jgi:cation diffusion facilitator family transporter
VEAHGCNGKSLEDGMAELSTLNKDEASALKATAALWSIAASVVITLAKGAAGFMTGSLALISDAAHSLLDVAATTMTYFIIKAAEKPADDEHHYGHGKIESLGALVETAFLFLLSGAVAYEGLRRLWTGEGEVSSSWFAVGVLLASIVIDAWRWFALTRAAKATNSEALAADALHFSSDLVNSVLILMAFAAAAYGFQKADALVAVGVSLFIAVAGFRLLRRTVGTLLDAAPKGLAELIRPAILQVSGVVAVDALKLRPAGAQVTAEVAIRVSRTLPLERLAAIKTAIDQEIDRLSPGAMVTVTASPVALDDETIMERILLVAGTRHCLIHHITIHRLGETLSIGLDYEVDGAMSLNEAHERSTRLEEAIKAEFGAGTEVDVHIEPLEINEFEGRAAEPKVVEQVRAALMQAASMDQAMQDVHNLRVRETTEGLVVHYHCRFAPDCNVRDVHERVDTVEQRLKQDIRQIRRVVGHAEPLLVP